MKYFLRSIVVLIFSCSMSVNASETGVFNLRCDEKDNPVGVSQKDLSFSWLWKAETDRNQQESYRIVVSSTLKNLERTCYDVWDSGRIRSANSIHVPFKGKKLEGGHKYFWRVLLWDFDNQASEWSAISSFVTAIEKPSEWHGAKWIGYEDMPENMRLVPGIHTAENPQGLSVKKDAVVPYFRKSFILNKPIKEAYLFMTGLGQYEAFINGQRVSNSFMSPGWTYYDKQVLFNTYDLTAFLRPGQNALGTMVGNGFHYINDKRYLKLGIAFGYPKMICRLKITYVDGTEENIISDESWKATPSPVVFSSIYGGEDYDARTEKQGWNDIGYDDDNWAAVRVVIPPHGKLEPETTFPLCVMSEFSPRNLYTINDSCFTYDFGQNASGIIEIRLKGKKGDRVRIWPGELLLSDKKINQKATGTPYYYEYILKGGEEEVWRPRFTYYGFRYVMVEGASPIGFKYDQEDKPVVSRIELLHTRNSAPQVGSFECSSELMNKTFHLIDWAIRSNMQSVLTDCPHREKLGWLEQSYLMGNSIRYNYSLYHLYRKQIRDMIHAQRNDGLIPDIAPEYVTFSEGFVDSPEWGSAAVILPWMVYKWYGDKCLLEESYQMMSRYVAYLESRSDNHIVSYGLGDWFDYGPNLLGVAQLTPVALTATAIYYYDVKLLADIAGILHKNKDAARYAKLAEAIKKAFNHQFYDPKKKDYATGSQTAIAMPLCVGLVNEENKKEVFASLCKTIAKDSFALTAGDVGFHFLVEALSDAKSAEILYKMINREDVPGYGFQLAKGATALTESWPALEEVSNNHLMLGHIMEWFYTCLLGINDAPDAIASDKVILRPIPVGDITWAKGQYLSPRGLIKMEWRKENEDFNLKCTVPSGIKAKIVIPEDYKTLKSLKTVSSSNNPKVDKSLDGNIVIETSGGEYGFCFGK